VIPLTNFLGRGIVSLISIFNSDFEEFEELEVELLLLEQAELEAEVANLVGGGADGVPTPPVGNGEGICTPQC